ncbi:MAG TPA: hypothetical protein VI197_23080 [Polyangiaceae bacterium]
MAIAQSPFTPLVIAACLPFVLAACGDSPAGDSAGEDGATTRAAIGGDTGQASLTSTGAGTQGSSATLGATLTTAQASSITTATSAGSQTTSAGGFGGDFSDTTLGGAVSSTGAGAGGTGGVVGAGGVNSTASAVSSSGGAGGSGGSDTVATNGSGGGSSECEFSGNVSYRFNDPSGWPSDVVELLTSALDEATYYYNCYADLSKELTINYDPGVPTAQGNVDGWISFGSSRSYMVVATAMHEVAHTLGVGYSPWAELMNDGTWTGPAVVEFMTHLPAEQRDPDMYSQRTYITGDSQHFWPYGLNQASEHQSEWSLINHVRIVAAMQLDKRAYLDGDL